MKNADRMTRDRKRVEETINRLKPEVVLDLCRRAGSRAVKDASPQGPRSRNSISDPTLSAVVRSMSERTVADPIFDSVRDIARLLDEMARMSMKLDDLVRYVQTGKEQEKAKEIAECKVCQRVVYCTPSDRLRSGMCQACYVASRRAKAQ
jgi:hypothetical protein